MTAMTLPIPVIETERLILRAPHGSDLSHMAAFFETERSHFVGGPRDLDGAWQALVARLGHWVLNDHGLWHITEKATRAFVGWAGVIFAPGWQEPELGWTVFDAAEGRGIALEAATAARRYAALHQGHDGVISYVRPDNHRSRALAQRLGATLETTGTLRGTPCEIWRHPKQEDLA
ncbi:GNAT family N-acetyltransferase [Phaeobacter sp. B1627]|uniref:GNAT family N-acetyltransferase n=1 Tax=Phaeobacter sp. B1627 TaxID=2583809 RepID=UPI00111AF2D9|nr:GNAT family N-acetyltransferase [Phaeobacter sp. B1627]TNJ41124.1 GNAT family N-acetyltransferase [Phaeobacter sp. B1627]